MWNIRVIFHFFFSFFLFLCGESCGAFRRISLVLSCLRKESCFATTCIAPQRTKKKKPESDEEEEEEHAGGPGEKEEEIKSRLQVFGSRRNRRRRRESNPLIFEEET